MSDRSCILDRRGAQSADMNTARRLLFAILLVVAVSTVAAQRLTVIDLHHRPAAELIPVLEPLVGPDTALTGVDYRLLIRGSDAEVARIRQALDVLDRAPKQLLVSVRYATQSDVDTQQTRVAGQVGTGGTDLSLRTSGDRRRDDAGNISSVRVTEGQAAFIASGESVPIVSAALATSGTVRGRVGAVIENREVGTGFRVQPRINGDVVVLDIGAQQDRLNGDSIAVHRVASQISGHVGEWLPLSHIDASGRVESSNVGAYRTQTATDRRGIWIKVEQLPD